MSSDEMTPELRALLIERLSVRADRLSRMAARNAPPVVIALFAEHVATTAILLFGEKFAELMIHKMVTALRECNGICLCGNAQKAGNQPLCQKCLDECEKHDREAEEHLAFYRPVKGQPS